MSIQSRLVLFALGFLIAGVSVAENTLKPFVMASISKGDVTTIAQNTKQKLTKAGFEIAGEYSPYTDTQIVIVTNDRLKKHAAQSEHGAYGAAQRVTITKTGDEVQVAFTNPVYMANVYRMKEDLQDVRKALAAALGDKGEYGPEDGLTKEDLREYHYKFLMPYFYDRLELASYKSYEQALEKVEQGLAKGKGGAKKVYRIDIPGKKESVFGVSLSGPKDVDCSGDKYIMERIDFKKTKSSGHLPYELIVTGGNVYALYAEFRIASNFPDLSMIGSNSFASIMCAPTAIQDALTQAAGGKMDRI